MKLYKDKYLIAFYNKKDELQFVADNPTEFAQIYLNFKKKKASINPEYVKSYVSHCFNNPKYKKNGIYFIDTQSIHKDVFEDEDKDFIDFVNENLEIKQPTIKDLAKILNVSIRTISRYKKQGLLNKKLKELKNVKTEQDS